VQRGGTSTRAQRANLLKKARLKVVLRQRPRPHLRVARVARQSQAPQVARRALDPHALCR